MVVIMAMAVAMVRVPMPAQDDKDERIDQDPHQRQDKHNCTPTCACQVLYIPLWQPNNGRQAMPQLLCTASECAWPGLLTQQAEVGRTL